MRELGVECQMTWDHIYEKAKVIQFWTSGISFFVGYVWFCMKKIDHFITNKQKDLKYIVSHIYKFLMEAMQ